MKCIYCGCMDSKVIDSRINEEGTSIRRRRECTRCGKRFTTYETVEDNPIYVIKKSGGRQLFDSNKMKQGIVKACEKRPVSVETIDTLVNDIIHTINDNNQGEITSAQIGEYIMDGLKNIDDVAYVRFAAIYRQFKDINTWLSEINQIIKNKNSDENNK